MNGKTRKWSQGAKNCIWIAISSYLKMHAGTQPSRSRPYILSHVGKSNAPLRILPRLNHFGSRRGCSLSLKSSTKIDASHGPARPRPQSHRDRPNKLHIRRLISQFPLSNESLLFLEILRQGSDSLRPEKAFALKFWTSELLIEFT